MKTENEHLNTGLWPSGRWHKTVNLAREIFIVGSNPIGPAK